ncbi:MAG: hypothetical protein DRO94_02355 [Candidatus Altiarchaeales archaeon]|nr:MAG: hypothetical protein DRO94_02355 [Candidatus Altiarchaeales archaeon]HDO82345.1 hypothetical protein [Candidatus Altiarchaeales archaeon]HEX54994.1 hypothetical protein [Candidatus Altiarchaeales archaeon]
MRKIILFLTLLILSNVGSGAVIRDIYSVPSEIPPSGKFTIKVELSGVTCGLMVKFYIDDIEFSSKYVKECGDSVESSEWDLDAKPLVCGYHKLRVELIDNDKIIQSREMNLRIGNVPDIEIIPEKPNPDSEITFRFTDNETGNPIKNLNVDIYNVLEGSDSAVTYSTNTNGEFKFITSDTGRYRLIIHSSNYCGELEFWVKKKLPYDLNPKNPVVGDLISLGVPGGVGVKYIDSEGNVYPLRNVGGVNFTINEPGNYTIVMGELSRVYWSENISIEVSEKKKMMAEIEPEKCVLNSPVTIHVTSGDKSLEGAIVKITKPDGKTNSYETNSIGEIKFIPDMIGEYTVHVEKEKYQDFNKKFDVLNLFNVRLVPREPIRNQEIVLNVTDQFKMPVGEASISIEEMSGIPLITGSTNENGTFRFRLPEEREYKIIIKKKNFWGFEDRIRAYGVMSLICPDSIEVGDEINLSVIDSNGNEIQARITIERPDGIVDVVENSYKPEMVGSYKIEVTKPNYRSVSKILSVRPHPLSVNSKILGNVLRITVLSRGVPVPGISVIIDTKNEKFESKTDVNGTTEFIIKEGGKLIIGVNSVDRKDKYETKIIEKEIVKVYNPVLLIIPIIFILMVAGILIAIIETLHRRSKIGEKKTSSLGGMTQSKRRKGRYGRLSKL